MLASGRLSSGPQGREAVRPPQLHGAVRGLLQPAELRGPDSGRATPGHPEPVVRRSTRRPDQLLPARRPRLGRGADPARRAPHHRRSRPPRPSADLGRIPAPIPQPSRLPEDPGSPHLDGSLRLPDARSRRAAGRGADQDAGRPGAGAWRHPDIRPRDPMVDLRRRPDQLHAPLRPLGRRARLVHHPRQLRHHASWRHAEHRTLPRRPRAACRSRFLGQRRILARRCRRRSPTTA